MFKKVLSLVLVGLLVNMFSISLTYASSKEEKQSRFAARVKENVTKLGTGAEARVEVKLRDNRKLKGYVREAGEDSFVVVDAKTGTATTVAYPQVKQVKGNNLSTGAKIAIAVSIIVVLTLTVGRIG